MSAHVFLESTLQSLNKIIDEAFEGKRGRLANYLGLHESTFRSILKRGYSSKKNYNLIINFVKSYDSKDHQNNTSQLPERPKRKEMKGINKRVKIEPQVRKDLKEILAKSFNGNRRALAKHLDMPHGTLDNLIYRRDFCRRLVYEFTKRFIKSFNKGEDFNEDYPGIKKKTQKNPKTPVIKNRKEYSLDSLGLNFDDLGITGNEIPTLSISELGLIIEFLENNLKELNSRLKPFVNGEIGDREFLRNHAVSKDLQELFGILRALSSEIVFNRMKSEGSPTITQT